jgi:hypothetical protein
VSSRPARFDPDETWSARNGRQLPYSTVGHWLLLSGVSSRAIHVYGLLQMHVNAERRNGRAWPSQGTLAAMVGIKKYDQIGKAITELVDVGAVEVEVEPTATGRHNTYTVHTTPPPGFAGPETRDAWYDARGLLPK